MRAPPLIDLCIDDRGSPTERFRDLEARAPAEERFGSPRSRIDRYGDERAPGGAESFEHQDFGDGPTLPASPRRSLGSSRPVTDGFSTVDFLRDYLKDRPCPPSGHPDSVCYKIMKERDASAGFASVAHDRAAMTDSPLFRSSWDGDVPSRTYSSSRSPLSLNDRPSFGNVGGYDSGGDGLRSTSTYGATRQNPLGGGLRSTDQPYGGARDFASTAHYPSAPYPTSTYSTAFDGLDDGGGGGNGGDGGDYGGGGGDDGYFGGGGGWGDSGGGFSMGGDPRAYPSLSSRESGMLTGCSHSGGLGALVSQSSNARRSLTSATVYTLASSARSEAQTVRLSLLLGRRTAADAQAGPLIPTTLDPGPGTSRRGGATCGDDTRPLQQERPFCVSGTLRAHASTTLWAASAVLPLPPLLTATTYWANRFRLKNGSAVACRSSAGPSDWCVERRDDDACSMARRLATT